jgi:hypothetical protein
MIGQIGRITVLILFDTPASCDGQSCLLVVLFLGWICEILVVRLSLLMLMAWNVTSLRLR